MIQEKGAWSWLRFLRGGEFRSTGLPDVFKVRIDKAGHHIDYELHAGSVDNPFELDTFQHFRCVPRF